jgi:hypothetical protein
MNFKINFFKKTISNSFKKILVFFLFFLFFRALRVTFASFAHLKFSPFPSSSRPLKYKV